MKIDIHINSSEATRNEFAVITLHCDTHNASSMLDLEFSPLHDHCQIPDLITLDFLLLASMVYAVDKLILRKKTEDQWTRSLQFTLPVSEPDKWSAVRDDLETCISFLTGDNWEIQFTKLQHELYRPKQRKRPRRKIPSPAQGNTVSLFSGGLDSLVGVINYLESNPSKNIFLIGHRDGSGPMSDQKRLFNILVEHYQSRIDLLQVRVGHKLLKNSPEKQQIQEKTFRSRSLLFIALGIYVARSIGYQTPLLIPENGAIAINVPLTPSRRGSCSTRTAHPFFLDKLREIFSTLGLENQICNPLYLKTKGECVVDCQNKELLFSTALESVSCAKRGHKRKWFNRTARECGMCIPCIYRRAALHIIGLDKGVNYGRDICIGDVNLDTDKRLADDFRSLISFLHRNYSKQDIARLLLSNGNIEPTHLKEYVEIVERAIREVCDLLQDKGIDDIKQRAGLTS